MAGPTVPYPIAKFKWTWTHTGGDAATEFHLKWGTQTGVYPNTEILSVAPPYEAYIHDILPGDGQYYAKIWAANGAGEGTSSDPETPFIAQTIMITIGAEGVSYSIIGQPVTLPYQDSWLRYWK